MPLRHAAPRCPDRRFRRPASGAAMPRSAAMPASGPRPDPRTPGRDRHDRPPSMGTGSVRRSRKCHPGETAPPGRVNQARCRGHNRRPSGQWAMPWAGTLRGSAPVMPRPAKWMWPARIHGALRRPARLRGATRRTGAGGIVVERAAVPADRHERGGFGSDRDQSVSCRTRLRPRACWSATVSMRRWLWAARRVSVAEA